MTNQELDRNHDRPERGFAKTIGRLQLVRIGLSAMSALVGLILVAGGGWLVLAGGSFYYGLAGLAFLLNSALLYSGSAWTYWAFALLTLTTLGWAIFEVGLDWWQLLPRGNLVVVVGVILVVPWVARKNRLSLESEVFRSGHLALVGSLIACGVVALLALLAAPHDLAGELPQPRGNVADSGGGIGAGKDWVAYGGTNAGDRYSTLDQITPQNVRQLQQAWLFHTGDVRGNDDPVETTYEVTPLKIGDTLYLCTPHDLVFALDAETGQEKWRFDPKIRQPPFQTTQHLTCRGVSYSDASSEAPSMDHSTATDCVKRIFLPTVDGRLFALSAESGMPCLDFGAGRVRGPMAKHAQCQPGFLLFDVTADYNQGTGYCRRRGER